MREISRPSSRFVASAEQITARYDRLDVLLNNAGLGAGPRGRRRRELSADGYELRFQAIIWLPSC